MYLEFDPKKEIMRRIKNSRYLISNGGDIFSAGKMPLYFFKSVFIQRMGNTNFVLSSQNQLYNLKKIRKLEVDPNAKGYRRIKLRLSGDDKLKHYRLSRLTAAAFVPTPKNADITSLQVHHIDGNNANDKATNLKWVDKTEHRKIHSKRKRKKKRKALQT